MDYCKSQNVYFQENGLQFTPCELKDYEYFVWMISPFDGEIYYTNNNSDKAIDQINKRLIDHSPDFPWQGKKDFTPITDEDIFALIPQEVLKEQGWTKHQSYPKHLGNRSWFSTHKFDDKSRTPFTWKWVQEKGQKLKHFKSPRCIKETEVKKTSPDLL